MFWTEKKLAKRIEELAEYRYRNIISIPGFKYKLDQKSEVGQYPPEDGPWQTIKIGDKWQGRDTYIWLAVDIDLPSEWSDSDIVGIFDFGKTGGGNNSGFESLLFLNGKPYQGVDSNHKEVFIPNQLAGSRVQLRFRLWSGLEGGGPKKVQEHELKQATLACLDKSTDDFYFTGRAVLGTVNVLEESSPERAPLLRVLNSSFNQLDWSKPGSQEFYNSINTACKQLNHDLKSMEKHHPVTVNCVGHTHIDVAWLWRLQHTREKCARSFNTVLRLMERYPEYNFLQSQPQLYKYIKSDYPEVYEQIKDRIKEGRWESDGAMWVEADCNISSGESLVRQILYGSRFFKDEFGIDCKYLWLPDVFGYSWALPQILKKSGIDTFMTTKISWNQYNRLPHDTFYWRGIDGSEILTHFITTPEVDQPEKWWYTYNGLIEPTTINGIWEKYRDKEINQELLLSYGYGDGGGGVNRHMLEMRKRLDEMPGLPKVKTGRVDDYFEGLHQRLDNTDGYIHTWNGELYLEYHRGTYTSQAYNKKMNRKLELLYRDTEWLNTLNCIIKNKWESYPQQELNKGWEIILRNQFHDIIPGSSINEVYQDSRKEYAEAKELAYENLSNIDLSIGDEKQEQSYTIFNSSLWNKNGLITIKRSSDCNGKWFDINGQELLAQQDGSMWAVQASEIPAMGYSTINFKEAVVSDNKSGPENNINKNLSPFNINIDGKYIETPFYQISWNDRGQLVYIYDKEYSRPVLEEGERGNVLQVFEDKPLQFDAWDIDIYYQEKQKEVSELQSVELIEKGQLKLAVCFKWSYQDSFIEQTLNLYRDNRRIDFQTRVDWHERQELLKVAFPVSIHSCEATYDIQYGNVKRPTHWNTSWDYARFESVGHQWVDLSERNYGVSLLNDCKYGHDIKDNVIRLSLIKSGIYPDTEADQGIHQFTYSLYPHSGDWYQGKTVQQAWDLNQPLRFAVGEPASKCFSMFKSSVDNIMIDAVKKAEYKDKVILRIHEYAGARVPVEISSDFEIVSWQECNLMERPEGEINESNTLDFEIKPYEIKTFLIDIRNL